MTDTQATNMVGCYSGKALNTNNIDALAKHGVRFNSAYTCSPVCTPARAGLFTGIYSNQSGPWSNNIAPGKNISTMGRYFKDAGYDTCYVGKWHLDGHDYYGTGVCPTEWNEDYWFDGANYLAELSDQQIALWRNGLNSVEDLEKNRIDETFTWAHRISDRAIRYLDEKSSAANQPFLMVLSYDEPHHPFTCPPDYLKKYQDFHYDLGPKAFDDLVYKPEHQRVGADAMASPVDEQGLYYHPLYFACNDFVDDEIGRVIRHLDQGEIDNTWLIYTSDHGEMLGKFGMWWKCSLYEDSVRIPMIAAGPDFQRNRKYGTPVELLDIHAFLYSIYNIERPDECRGIPLNELPEASGERIVFSEYHGHGTRGSAFMVRRGNWKLIYYTQAPNQLFNLELDPDELHDVSADHPDIMAELTTELQKICNPEEVDTEVQDLIDSQLRAISELDK